MRSLCLLTILVITTQVYSQQEPIIFINELNETELLTNFNKTLHIGE